MSRLAFRRPVAPVTLADRLRAMRCALDGELVSGDALSLRAETRRAVNLLADLELELELDHRAARRVG